MTDMERMAEEKISLLSMIKDNYSTYLKRRAFEVKPQMPPRQISHFMKQAVRKEALITIQLNPTPLNKMMSEATGVATFSPYSTQVILTSQDNKTVHLINADQIRHIRLEK